MRHGWAARITSRVGAIVVLVAALALTVLTFVTSPEQPEAEPTDGLPAGAQSTRVTELQDRFPSGRAAPVLVVVFLPAVRKKREEVFVEED